MGLTRRAARNVLDRNGGIFSTGSADPYTIPANGQLGFTSSGVLVNDQTSLQLLAVTACVRLISETLSNMKLEVVKDTADGRCEVVANPSAIVADPFGGNNIVNGLTTKAGIAQLATSALLRGNAYGYITQFDSMFRPMRMRVLPPDAVDVDVNEDGFRVYKIMNQEVDAQRMFHVTGMALPGQPVGLSVIEYARRTIGLGLAAEEFGSRFFGRGANMTGIIEVPQDLKPEKAKELKEGFESRNSGLSNSHAVGVLTGGAKFAKISVTPEEAQFLLTRGMATTDIAMLYGVPPHMLGQTDRTTSWGKGIEEQTLGFTKFTMGAWAQRFEDGFSACLPRGQRARFDFETLLRPDSTGRFMNYQVARNSSIYTPNEIRALENMPPVDGGDDLFAPLNSAHTTEPDWVPGKPEDSPDKAPAAPADPAKTPAKTAPKGGKK